MSPAQPASRRAAKPAPARRASAPDNPDDAIRGRLACVVLAHTDPAQVRRLVGALAPLPVFLHCDVTTPDDVYEAMTADLPASCTLLPRMRTGWARWENVAAEVAGYAAALARPEVTHVATFTGTDYPLAHAADLDRYFGGYEGLSFGLFQAMPVLEWGPTGGFDRVRFRHYTRNKRMYRIPVPRRLPADVVFAGGSQVKVIARPHAQAVLDCITARPDIVRFWKRVWIPDETFIPSVLHSPAFVPNFEQERVRRELWFIRWAGAKKSPGWVQDDYLDYIRGVADPYAAGMLFARKFASDRTGAVQDRIDALLRRPGRLV